jgi:hypothetical protein
MLVPAQGSASDLKPALFLPDQVDDPQQVERRAR